MVMTLLLKQYFIIFLYVRIYKIIIYIVSQTSERQTCLSASWLSLVRSSQRFQWK